MKLLRACLSDIAMKEILIKPLITEKMSADTERNNSYGFVVSLAANKIQSKKAIENEYNVTVESVRTMRVDGKTKQRYTKTGMVKGRTNSFKKALVSLAKGEAIDFYDNI